MNDKPQRETCLNLCATCRHRQAQPACCIVGAPAARLAREGSRVDHCALYNGRDGSRAVSEAGPGR